MNFIFFIVYFLLFRYLPFWVQERALVGIWGLGLVLCWHSHRTVISGISGAFGRLASTANQGSQPVLPAPPQMDAEHRMDPVGEHARARGCRGRGKGLTVEMHVVKSRLSKVLCDLGCVP